MVAADNGLRAESCQRQHPNLTQEVPLKRVARSPFSYGSSDSSYELCDVVKTPTQQNAG